MKQKQKNSNLVKENTHVENTKSKYTQSVKNQFESEGGLEKKLKNSQKIFEAAGKMKEYRLFEVIMRKNISNQNKINIDHFSVEINASNALFFELVEAGQVKILEDIITNYLGIDFKYTEKNINLLQLACMRPNIDVVKLYINLKTVTTPISSIMNFKNEDGVGYLFFLTCVNLAKNKIEVKSKIIEIIDYFCELGLDVNATCSQGKDAISSILDISYQQGKLNELAKEIIRYLIKKGANFKATPGNLVEKIFLDMKEGSELKLLGGLMRNRLFSEIKTRKIDSSKFRAMLNDSNVPINSLDVRGCGFLHYAAYRGHMEILPIFINKDNINKQDIYGMAPILYATKNNKTKAVLMLIESGADISVVNIYNEGMMHYAAATNQVKLMKLLMETKPALLNNRSLRGYLPIHKAAAYGSLEALEFLLGVGQDINELTKNGNTALHIAAEEGHIELFEYLVGVGATTNIPNRDGKLAEQILNSTKIEETSKISQPSQANIMVDKKAQISKVA